MTPIPATVVGARVSSVTAALRIHLAQPSSSPSPSTRKSPPLARRPIIQVLLALQIWYWHGAISRQRQRPLTPALDSLTFSRKTKQRKDRVVILQSKTSEKIKRSPQD